MAIWNNKNVQQSTMEQSEIKSFFLILCLVAFVQEIYTDSSFVFVAPKKLLSPSKEQICLSFNNAQQSTNINIQLVTFKRKVIASINDRIEIDNTSTFQTRCLNLTIPTIQRWFKGYLLILNLTRDGYPTESYESQVYIHKKDTIIPLFETNKPIYKAGEMVKIRALFVQHDFRLHIQDIKEIYISNPQGVRVAQWANVVSNKGIFNFQYQLASQTLEGTWAIYCALPGFHGNVHTFLVEKYTAPRFELSIITPPYILNEDTLQHWKICANYLHGNPVLGKVKIKMTGIKDATYFAPDYLRRNKTISRKSHLKSDGCALFGVRGSRLGLGQFPQHVRTNTISIEAMVTEKGTDMTLTANRETPVSRTDREYQFEDLSPKHFKYGLPYWGNIRVLYPDKTPVAADTVQICVRPRLHSPIGSPVPLCTNRTTDANGIISYIIPPLPQNARYLDIQIKPTLMPNMVAAHWTAYSWVSESGYALQLKPQIEDKQIHVLCKIPAKKIARRYDISVNYLIKSRGDIVSMSTVKLNSTAVSIFDLPEELVLSWNTDDWIQSSEEYLVLLIKIPLEISPFLSKNFKVLVYIQTEQDLITDSRNYNTPFFFANQVNLKWRPRKTMPGETTNLIVESSPNSICGLMVVDYSTTLLAELRNLEFRINIERATKNLQNFDSGVDSQPIQENEAEPCSHGGDMTEEFLEMSRFSRPRNRRHIIFNNKKHASSLAAFDEFGTIVFTNLNITKPPCSRHSVNMLMYKSQSHSLPVMNDAQMYDQSNKEAKTALRHFFPESWIWETISVGSTGKTILQYDSPHTITQWEASMTCISAETGLGMSPIASLHTFQFFFIDMIVPHTAKRGETLVINAAVFNYLKHDLPIRVTVSLSGGIFNTTDTMCLPEKDSISRKYLITPTQLGDFNITVIVQVDELFEGACGPETLVFFSDSVLKTVKIKPEGVPTETIFPTVVCTYKDILNTLTLPEGHVPGSSESWISVTGGIMGPALQNLDKLVLLPTGCGEQNMALLAPNVFVLNYLTSKNKHEGSDDIIANAIDNIQLGYQRQLNYRHNDGSFSAFGTNDKEGSLWLTAFVLRVLSQVKKLQVIEISDQVLQDALHWIIRQQLENGCFLPIGLVFQKAMTGGVSFNSGIEDEEYAPALSAYVIASIIEADVDKKRSGDAITAGLFCLINAESNELYGDLLRMYAFSLVMGNESIAGDMDKLIAKATTKEDLLWWEAEASQNLALTIEQTAYGILILTNVGTNPMYLPEIRQHWKDLANKAVLWLIRYRNGNGGFVSTQDTVIALQALSAYSSWVYMEDPQLEINVFQRKENAAELEESQIIVTPENQYLLQTVPIFSLPSDLRIVVSGKGCASIAMNMHYNMPPSYVPKFFELDVKSQLIKPEKCSAELLQVCFAYTDKDGKSNMALLDVNLPTGYEPHAPTLEELKNNALLDLKRIDIEKGRVIFYFESLGSGCVEFKIIPISVVLDLKPATVTIYDYYQRDKETTTKYSVAGNCTGEENSDESSDKTETVITTTPRLPRELEIEIWDDYFQLTHKKPRPTGLNPDFIDMEEDLDFPDGDEAVPEVILQLEDP